MEKIIISALCIFLIGCGNNLVKPESGTKAIYKRYNIVMPIRPDLEVSELSEQSSIGEAARAYENDLLNIIEYSLQLENILKPIVDSEDEYPLEPVKPLEYLKEEEIK